LWQNWFRDYDHRTGRYVEGDPIGLGGGVNGYVYVDGKPIGFIDILGLIAWKTEITTTAVVPGGGAAAISFKFTSKCVDGKMMVVSGIAGGFAVGLGLKGGVAISQGSYEDHKKDLDPYQFEGAAKFVSAGVSISVVGLGVSALQLGEARIIGGGWQGGIDFSVIGGSGISTVENVEVINCCNGIE